MNPIKPNWRTEIVPSLFLLAGIVASFYFYARLPEQVATHWNAAGEIDGYSGRAFAAFFFPLLNVGIYFLMLFLPLADPKKKNYEQFRPVYHLIKGALVVFMASLYFVISLNGLGLDIPVGLVVPIGVGGLFVIIGLALGKVKQNWFMGIRTPWTLSSEIVWKKTHKLGRYVFVLAGALIILASVYSRFFLGFIIIILALIFALFIYSYLIYRRQK